MIDNIKFNFDYQGDADWINRVRESTILNPSFRNGFKKGYKARLFLDKDKTRIEKKDGKLGRFLPSLDILIIERQDYHFTITIRNSIRKWYSNDKFTYCFNKKEFKKCIKKIAIKLNVPDYLIYHAIVTKVEYGASVNMDQRFRCFYDCLFSHQHLMKKKIIGAESVSFFGDAKSVIFYDKIVEQKDKDKMKAKTQKQINKKAICLRYEIKFNRVSAVPFAKENMGTIGAIYENWDKIADSWYDELDNVSFVNNLTPNVYNYLENKRKLPFQNFLVYLGIEKLGVENLRVLLLEQSHVNTRRSSGMDFLKIYNDFKELVEDTFFEDIFRAEIRAKVLEIKS